MKSPSFSSITKKSKAVVLTLLLLVTLGAGFAPVPVSAQAAPPGGLTADQQKTYDNLKCMTSGLGAAPLVGVLWCYGKEIVGSVASATFGAIMEGVGYVILSLANFILYLVGVLFNYVIVYTVFQFGNYFGNSQGLLAAWGILRDVANIMLIFGFVMLGMATILDIHGYEVKKTLPRLIIFAILMNFSLLASEAVIDTANAFAAVFYSQASTLCTQTGQDSEGTCANDGTNGGISAEIVQMAGITSIFSTPNPNKSGETGADETSNIQWGVIYIGMALFVTILCIVLLAGSIMLITRAITLGILMILSPLGFAGLAIPPLEKYAMMWWNKLISQAFFAPVYLLFIFVALKIVKGLSGGTISVGSALSSGDTGAIGSILIFGLLIGFLIAALLVAKNMGAIGADFATNGASALVFGTMTRAANFAGGGIGYLGRNVIQNSKQKDHWVARGLVNYGFKPLEKANLDVRRAPGVGGLLGAAGIKEGAKPAEHATFGDMKHAVMDIAEFKDAKERNKEYDDDIKKKDLDKEAHDTTTPDLTDKSKDFLLKRSTEELVAMHGIKAGVSKLVENLSPEQFEALMKSDKLSDAEKETIRTARFSTFNAAIEKAKVPGAPAADVDAARKLLRNMNKSDLENAPSAIIMDNFVLTNLSGKQRDNLADSKKRSTTEVQRIRASAPGAVFETAFKANPATAPDIRRLKASEVAKLDTSTITHKDVVPHLSSSVLIKLQEEGTLTPNQMTDVGNEIRAFGPTAAAYTYVTSGPGATVWA